ncbi:MAG: hypothetical protein IJQ50_06605 [Clostridia bacterium]|nr:hypothetical protein [Clostridia bacterium]
MDNLSSIVYNNIRNNTSATSATDYASQWKEKNKLFLKYAGDGAKKSIDKGLKEAPLFMRDAGEGTSFENVQTASVKRQLANDANNHDLYNSSMMEMIGYLSDENKEKYLENVQPLQRYIDVKDEFDFKNNNYNTTGYIDKTPDIDVMQLQRELNESGYTDKFGQKLIEDGIYAGKTAYAYDSRLASNNNSSYRAGNRKEPTINDVVADVYNFEYPATTIGDVQTRVSDSPEIKLVSADKNTRSSSSKPDKLKYLPDVLYNAWDKAEDSIWKTGAKVLDIYGWHMASDLLTLAASGKGHKYIVDEGSYASNLLKNDKGINKCVNDAIWEYGTSKGNKNPKIPPIVYTVPLTNGDLGASLHKITLYIDAKQNKNGTWTAKVKATDNYDFTEKKSLQKILEEEGLKSKFLWLSNDIAVKDTELGFLDNVEVEISFKNNY